MSAYREVTFRIYEEDFVPGLTVTWLSVGEELVPFAWMSKEWGDHRPLSYSNREGDSVVDTEVYGGTLEQFEFSRDRSCAFQEVHGRKQGVYAHFPRSRRRPL